MKQVKVKTSRVEDGLVLLSVLYNPSTTPLKTIRSACRSLLQTKTSLFVSATFESADDKQSLFFATMNPNGSQPVLLTNITLFRVWAERLTSALCCIDMEGFDEPTKKTSPVKKRSRSK